MRKAVKLRIFQTKGTRFYIPTPGGLGQRNLFMSVVLPLGPGLHSPLFCLAVPISVNLTPKY